MKPQITVLDSKGELPSVAWGVFHTQLGAPRGYIGRIDAPTKQLAEDAARLLYGQDIAVQAERPHCNHCGEYLPCSKTKFGCSHPESDGNPW